MIRSVIARMEQRTLFKLVVLGLLMRWIYDGHGDNGCFSSRFALHFPRALGWEGSWCIVAKWVGMMKSL